MSQNCNSSVSKSKAILNPSICPSFGHHLSPPPMSGKACKSFLNPSFNAYVNANQARVSPSTSYTPSRHKRSYEDDEDMDLQPNKQKDQHMGARQAGSVCHPAFWRLLLSRSGFIFRIHSSLSSCRFRGWQWLDSCAFRFTRIIGSSESCNSRALVSLRFVTERLGVTRKGLLCWQVWRVSSWEARKGLLCFFMFIFHLGL